MSTHTEDRAKVMSYLPTIPIFPLPCCDAISISRQHKQLDCNQSVELLLLLKPTDNCTKVICKQSHIST